MKAQGSGIALLEKRRILVVEDEYLIARDIQRDLEDAGAIVLGPVPSVAKALALLENGPAPDAAVLDVNLGDEKSFAIAAVLEEKAIPFLFATGYNEADIPDQWRKERIETKPLRLTSVIGLFDRARD